MSRALAIAVHDVSPLTLAASRQLVELVEEVAGGAVPLTLLVIPHHRRERRIDADTEFRRWIDARVARGDEVALHGLWHVDDGPPPERLQQWWHRRVMTDGEAEFAALTRDQARMRIEHGLALFAACGWLAHGFIAPAWQMSAPARAVLPHYPFAYTATRNTLEPLAGGRACDAPALSLSGRSPVRRWLSQGWAQAWMRMHAGASTFRIALHPVDAQFEVTRALWRQCLSHLLADAVPRTKRQLAAAAAEGERIA